jgi:hypothetical protein
MGKEKKKDLVIKTSRYYTKSCDNCNFEYPNWFTNCPKCGAAWNEGKIESIGSSEKIIRKNIKIIVKITEEDFNESIENVNLIFSADQGKSWYKTKMEFISDYFESEIVDVPGGSKVIYYIEVSLENGEQVIENNEGKYFHYKVGEPEEVIMHKEDPESQLEEETTVFGKAQTKIDPNLKICPHCNSKIKKMWSVCPICGKSF